MEVALQNKEVSTEASDKPCAADTGPGGGRHSIHGNLGRPVTRAGVLAHPMSCPCGTKNPVPLYFPCCHGVGQLQLQPQEVMAIKLRS